MKEEIKIKMPVKPEEISFKDMISFAPREPKLKVNKQEPAQESVKTNSDANHKAEMCIEKHIDEFQKKIDDYEIKEAIEARAQSRPRTGKRETRWSKVANKDMFTYETTSDSESTYYSSDDSSRVHEISCSTIYTVFGNKKNSGELRRKTLAVDNAEMIRLQQELCQEGESIISMVPARSQMEATCADRKSRQQSLVHVAQEKEGNEGAPDTRRSARSGEKECLLVGECRHALVASNLPLKADSKKCVLKECSGINEIRSHMDERNNNVTRTEINVPFVKQKKYVTREFQVLHIQPSVDEDDSRCRPKYARHLSNKQSLSEAIFALHKAEVDDASGNKGNEYSERRQDTRVTEIIGQAKKGTNKCHNISNTGGKINLPPDCVENPRNDKKS